MLKTGIYNLKQLRNKNLDNIWNKRKNIALNLYFNLYKQEFKDLEGLEETILERFNLANSSYRRTYTYRFENFDKEIIDICQNYLPFQKNYKIHDAAISDGKIACEFFDRLQDSLNSNITFLGSDNDLNVLIYSSIKNKHHKIITDERGNILQFVLPPFVLNASSPKKTKWYKLKHTILYFINYLLLKLLKNKKVKQFLLPVTKNDYKTLKLLANKTLKYEKGYDNFSLMCYNLLKVAPEKFDLVRAMNVINPSYFNRTDVTKIAKNLKDSLKENGLLVIGSNKEANSPVNGNILQKRQGNLYSIKQFNQGAPFIDLFVN